MDELRQERLINPIQGVYQLPGKPFEVCNIVGSLERLMKLWVFAFILLLSCTRLVQAAPVPLSLEHARVMPIGLSISYLHEEAEPLTLQAAQQAQAAQRFRPSRESVLNFSIGSKPVWLYFRLSNPSSQALMRVISLQIAWLDKAQFFLLHDGILQAEWTLGDQQDFFARPINSPFLMFEHAFKPGITEVFLRIQTPDIMLAPLYVMSVEQTYAKEELHAYSYGFLYGFLIALIVYNLKLFFGLRDTRYALYSLYLGAFILMNISYTGHGFAWLWPYNTAWAQWSNPVLMTLYAATGLVFAARFLEIGQHYPKICRSLPYVLGVTAFLMMLAIGLDSQPMALALAFGFVLLFSISMFVLGFMTLHIQEVYSRYFLLATFFGVSGAFISSLAGLGWISFTSWTFRAAEIGMMIDATLLALALTYRLKEGQLAMRRAEELAMLDPLTGMNNRRSFYDKAMPIWNISKRNNRPLSVVMLDLDYFKKINDDFGHACGDMVLVEVAGLLKKLGRKQDIVARWGGEEMIILLPETTDTDAAHIAERVRQAIEAMPLQFSGHTIKLTSSFGVAQCNKEHLSLDSLISAADNCLYQAKAEGRNRVAHA